MSLPLFYVPLLLCILLFVYLFCRQHPELLRLLALCSEIILNQLKGLYRMLRIKPCVCCRQCKFTTCCAVSLASHSCVSFFSKNKINNFLLIVCLWTKVSKHMTSVMWGNCSTADSQSSGFF